MNCHACVLKVIFYLHLYHFKNSGEKPNQTGIGIHKFSLKIFKFKL